MYGYVFNIDFYNNLLKRVGINEKVFFFKVVKKLEVFVIFISSNFIDVCCLFISSSVRL